MPSLRTVEGRGYVGRKRAQERVHEVSGRFGPVPHLPDRCLGRGRPAPRSWLTPSVVADRSGPALVGPSDFLVDCGGPPRQPRQRVPTAGSEAAGRSVIPTQNEVPDRNPVRTDYDRLRVASRAAASRETRATAAPKPG